MTTIDKAECFLSVHAALKSIRIVPCSNLLQHSVCRGLMEQAIVFTCIRSRSIEKYPYRPVLESVATQRLQGLDGTGNRFS